MAHRNVVERSNQNSIIHLIKTYKSYTDTPDLNPTGSPQSLSKQDFAPILDSEQTVSPPRVLMVSASNFDTWLMTLC